MKECQNNPCRNSLGCIELEGSYKCECPPGYTGQNCDISMYIQFHIKKTTCIFTHFDIVLEEMRDSNLLTFPYFQRKFLIVIFIPIIVLLNYLSVIFFMAVQRFSFTYLFQSINYDCVIMINIWIITDINECLTMDLPCSGHGECIDTMGSYRCICKPGWTGSHCDLDIHECTILKPCKHNSTCIEMEGGYRCQCLPGFQGKHCEGGKNAFCIYIQMNIGTIHIFKMELIFLLMCIFRAWF